MWIPLLKKLTARVFLQNNLSWNMLINTTKRWADLIKSPGSHIELKWWKLRKLKRHVKGIKIIIEYCEKYILITTSIFYIT